MLKRIWNRVRSLNLREIVSRADDDLLERLEERLITADFGMDATLRIIEAVSGRAGWRPDGVREALLAEVRSILSPVGVDFTLHDPSGTDGPSLFLLVGANGTGKTTTCARLAHRFIDDGRRVLLVAADTFRAGAAEQLAVWAGRLGCDIVRQASGADPAAVVYDGIEAAKSRGADVLLCDTAGRLHTKGSLMEELRKIHRVAAKRLPGAPHEILLVLDATTGQNGLRQAKEFHEALGLTGIVLCKMDGTAKGGIVVSIADRLGVPVKLIGVGEGADDLIPFDPDSFVKHLLGLSGDGEGGPPSAAARRSPPP